MMPELHDLYTRLENTLQEILTLTGHASPTDALYGHTVTLDYERLTADGNSHHGHARFPLRSTALR